MTETNLSLLERLNQSDWQEQLIAVEFNCDQSKKAIGKLARIGNSCCNYIELTGNILVRTSCKSGVNLEFPNQIVIPVSNICAIGLIGAPRPFICPCRATFGGTFREPNQSQRNITVRGQVCNPCFIPGTDTVLYTNNLSTNDQNGTKITLNLPAGAPEGGQLSEVSCPNDLTEVTIRGTAPVTVGNNSTQLRDFELVLKAPNELVEITIYNSQNGSFNGVFHQAKSVTLQGQGVNIRSCQS